MTLASPDVYVAPMLCQAAPRDHGVDVPPEGPQWGYEFKWDGNRCIASVEAGRVRLSSRDGMNITAQVPEVTEQLAQLRRRALLDGELVALDPDGRPSLSLLQQRVNSRSDRARFVGQVHVQFYAFDLLALDGDDITRRPLAARRTALEGLGLSGGCVRVPPLATGVTGADMVAIARSHRLEGIVAKRLNSPYLPGDRTHWVKVKLWDDQEVVVCGFTPGQDALRGTLGSLVMGLYDRGRLRYAGHVGSGFTDTQRHDALTQLQGLEPLGRHPFGYPVASKHLRGARWVQPRRVGEVRYKTVSPSGRLRYAVWRGWRTDKRPEDATLAREVTA